MSFFPDGRELDDMSPRDIPREVARMVDAVAEVIEGGGPSAENRAEMASMLRRLAQTQRQWAFLGDVFRKAEAHGDARRGAGELTPPASADNTLDLVECATQQRVGIISIRGPRERSRLWVTTLTLTTPDMRTSEDRFNHLCSHGIPGVYARPRA